MSNFGNASSSDSTGPLCRLDTPSSRIIDMIDEAFPLAPQNTRVEDYTQLPDPFDPFLPPSLGDVDIEEAPPTYDDAQQQASPPGYLRDLTLPDFLSEPHMSHTFSFPVKLQRITMTTPLPKAPLSTSYELLLLSPRTPFRKFLHIVHGKATAAIMSERTGHPRLHEGERVIFTIQVKWRHARGGIKGLGWKRKVKEAVNMDNWTAVLGLLDDRTKGAALKAKFWSEMPGSESETKRLQEVRDGTLERVEVW